jgi:hypothetical protein
VFWLIVTGVVGLAIGLWLGMPGRYSQTPEEIERIMAAGGGRRRKTKRVFTPMAWLQRRADAGVAKDRRRRTGRSGLKLERPDDRER